ncbi:MAG: AAA family ATPase [Thermoleophilaceae bacterium]
MTPDATPVATLAGTEDHPHARMVLGSGLASGSLSHAYLFHGPPGTGKRTAARALAAEILALGEADPDAVRRRVEHGAHPDLTWVKPTGAHVMRVSDIEEPVVAAATRTPFEASRRVFVLERADTMNDEVANRMLKTLEEPAAYVHIVLMTDALGQMLETVVSRCQLVRFDPLPAERLATLLEGEGVPPETAGACGRLALGNLTRARYLASEDGRALRDDVERLVRDALEGERREPRTDESWRALLVRAEEKRAEAEEAVARAAAERLELEPKGRERRALEREFEEMAKRDGRRARTEVLDLGLELAALTFRDLTCVAEGAEAAVLGTDAIRELAPAAQGRDPRRLREAAERCEDVRMALELNVMEDLALTALTLRLERLVGSG